MLDNTTKNLYRDLDLIHTEPLEVRISVHVPVTLDIQRLLSALNTRGKRAELIETFSTCHELYVYIPIYGGFEETQKQIQALVRVSTKRQYRQSLSLAVDSELEE